MNRKIVSILVCTLLIFVVVSFVEGQTPNVTVTQIISPSNGSLLLYDPQVEVTATSPENDVYVHLIINKIQSDGTVITEYDEIVIKDVIVGSNIVDFPTWTPSDFQVEPGCYNYEAIAEIWGVAGTQIIKYFMLGDCCCIEIDSIHSGEDGKGVCVDISNICDEELTGLSWTMTFTITGGPGYSSGIIAIPSGGVASGTIDIPASGTATICLFVSGNADFDLTVNVDCAEDTISGTINGQHTTFY